MAETKGPVVKHMSDALLGGSLGPDDVLVFRLRGGTKEERREELVQIRGDGRLHARVSDALKPDEDAEGSGDIGRAEVSDLLKPALAHIPKMIPVKEARFLPDSTIASVTFSRGTEQETFVFDADDDPALPASRQARPELGELMGRFQSVARRFAKRVERRH